MQKQQEKVVHRKASSIAASAPRPRSSSLSTAGLSALAGARTSPGGSALPSPGGPLQKPKGPARRRVTIDTGNLHSGLRPLHSPGGRLTPESGRSPGSSAPDLRRLMPGADVRAAVLAKRFQLQVREVHGILQAFELAEHNEQGGIDFVEFHKVLCKVFDVPTIKRETLQVAYLASDSATCFDDEKFFAWYVQSMFTEVVPLKASPQEHAGEEMVCSVARQHGICVGTVDRIKRQFNRYDQDGNGTLDFEEFRSMMATVLRAKTGDLGDNRLRKFWVEIDSNGDGTIDFPEFASWFLKYFNPEVSTADGFGLGPAEALYASYDPSQQRRKMFVRRQSL